MTLFDRLIQQLDTLVPFSIVSDADLITAAQKQEAYLKTQVGTNSGTVVNIKNKKGLTKTG